MTINQLQLTNELLSTLPTELQDKFRSHFYGFISKNNLSDEQKVSARILAFYFYQNGLLDGQS